MNEVDTPEDDKDLELGEEEADEQGDNEVLVSHHVQHHTSRGAIHPLMIIYGEIKWNLKYSPNFILVIQKTIFSFYLFL